MKALKVYLVVWASVAAVGATYAVTREFKEPVVEERPVVERRLVCPDGFELFELSKKYTGDLIITGTSSLNGYVTWDRTASDKTGAWQMGALPNPKDHVCVTKEEIKKHEHTDHKTSEQ